MPADLPFPESLPDIRVTSVSIAALKKNAADVTGMLEQFEALVAVPGPTEWIAKLAAHYKPADVKRGEALLQKLQIPQRMVTVRELAAALLTHRATHAAVEKTLIQALTTSRSQTFRSAIASQLLEARSTSGLAALDAWLDSVDTAPGRFHEEVWMTQSAIRARLLVRAPADAFDTLSVRLKTDPGPLLEALKYHEGPLDPRWFPVVIDFLDHEDGGWRICVEYIFGDHPTAEAEQVVVELLETHVAKRKQILPSLYSTVLRMKPKAAAAPIVSALEQALRFTDWRLNWPVTILKDLDNPAVVPRLRELLGAQKSPKVKRVLDVLVTHLSRNEPATATSVKPTSTKPTKPTKPARPSKPATAAVAPTTPAKQAVAKALAKVGIDADRGAELLAGARHRIDFATSTSLTTEVGSSRFGGIPDLPKGFAWPMHVESLQTLEGKLVLGLDEYPPGTFPAETKGKLHVPLAFVAQLRLADLAAADQDNLLPRDGMLWFFVRDEIHVDARGDLPKLACHVEYRSKPGSLTPTKPPATLPKRHLYKAAGVKVVATATLAPSSTEAYRKLLVVGDEEGAYGAAWEAGEAKAPPHSSLGWPRAAYFNGLPSKNQEVLLRVGSDPKTRMSWGDESAIFFCLAKAALEKRDFKAAFCLADE